jgi:hypothetical protein
MRLVIELTSACALRLRAVKIKNQNEDNFTAKGMEVLTGPAAEGPWTSVLHFTSARGNKEQTFAAAEGAPTLAGFVKVVFHNTYRGHASVLRMSLEGEAFGGSDA